MGWVLGGGLGFFLELVFSLVEVGVYGWWVFGVGLYGVMFVYF